ncbi:MAG: glycoside hydrolase, partial [Campylobacterales bacterium]|nr:glycoside hydrolase [Campylobacterales bacterium]
WGIKTTNWFKDGRYIIGKSIISTLNLGEELDNVQENSLLINRIKSINILTQ